jgi:DNA polymerase-3 subunit alpha
MFVPLRVQSCFSMLDSTIRVEALAAACAARRYPAVALTDRGNLHAALPFAAACLKAGVQPIPGVLLPVIRPVASGALRPGMAPPVDGLVLLAQSAAGWANLMRLVSAAHMEAGGALRHGPALPLAALGGQTEGLLALTGGTDGALARLLAEGQESAAEALATDLARLFPGRLFVEISRTGEAVEAASEARLVALADAHGLPLVASHIARFLEPAGHPAHDAMLCIGDGSYLEAEERRRSNPAHALPASAGEMAARFADLPDALANMAQVARMCAFAPGPRAPVLPRLETDEGDEARALRRMAADGLRARLVAVPEETRAAYRERLDFELAVISDKGFAGYFLIVADFIGWAKAQRIPVGPGRGSGAGSLVAWALGITDLDPIPLGLLFERFLNPERMSMPDFDIDFCETRREEVIAYVTERHGRAQVAQIITFGTLKARAAVKDVGRVMQMPYGQTDRLSKIIPADPANPWDLERTIREMPEFRAAMEAEPDVARLVEIARQLEGLPRHSSTHAAGVVIADRALEELVPLTRDPKSGMPVTQYDLKWSEEAGLVKFDFLGLRTLSVLARIEALLRAQGVAVDFAGMSPDDPATYAMMTRGDTVGVFQFESEGMRRALALVRPTRFEDIVALAALYRPGPMDNIPSFAARKWGREPVEMLHEAVSDILEPTYGIIVYQEQVMQIAQRLAGYSLGEADLLRRAMGKKKMEEMEAQKARFVEGAVARGVERPDAERIFALVEKFAGYGFNKSHAAAYALIAYQTAWAKAHHPAAFFAATLAYDIHDTDKLALLVEDMGRTGVPLLPPSINRSGADFLVEAGDGDGVPGVRYALGGLKGVGEAAMAALVAEREARGPFRSLDDMVSRIDPKLLNRRQFEALAAAGAFDEVGPDRAQVFAGAELLMAAAQSAAAARESGQGGLFGGGDSGAEPVPLPPAEPWGSGDRLAKEHAAFGFYLSGHPVDAFAAVLAERQVRTGAEVRMLRGDPGDRVHLTMAGIVQNWRYRNRGTRPSDGRRLLLDLSDRGGSWAASCHDPALQDALVRAAEAAEPLLFQVELRYFEDTPEPRITIRAAQALKALNQAARARLTIRLAEGAGVDTAGLLVLRLERGGRSEVVVDVPTSAGRATVRLGQDFALAPGIDADLCAHPAVETAEVGALGPPVRLVA